MKQFFAFSFVLAVFLTSCTDFFSNSLAPWAARDKSRLIPTVTAGNVHQLVELAECDPDLSLELLKGISSAVNGASPEDAARLQAAALAAAQNAIGGAAAIISGTGSLTSIENYADGKQAIIDAINCMQNLQEVAALLLDILPKPGTPEFDDFVNNASAADLALAAIIIIAAEAQKHGEENWEDYINSFNQPGSSQNPSEDLALALALAAGLEDRQDELGEYLIHVLQGLNLLQRP